MVNKYCPLCGEENKCMARDTGPCWCNEVDFPAGIFELVPPESKRKHCICLKCVMAYKEKSGTS